MNQSWTTTLLLLTVGVRWTFGQSTNEFTFEGTEAEHTEVLTGVELTTAPTDLSSTIEQQQTTDDVTVVQSPTVSVVSEGNNLETSSTSHGLNSTKDDVTKQVTSSTVKISSDNATSPLLGNDTTVDYRNATDKVDNRKPGAELPIKSQDTETKTIIIIIVVVVTVVGGLLVIAVVVGIIIKNRHRIMRLIRSKDEEVFVLNDRPTPTQGTDGRHVTEGHAPRTNPSPSGQVVAETGYQPWVSKGNVAGGGSSRLQERPAPHANAGYKDNESQRL